MKISHLRHTSNVQQGSTCAASDKATDWQEMLRNTAADGSQDKPFPIGVHVCNLPDVVKELARRDAATAAAERAKGAHDDSTPIGLQVAFQPSSCAFRDKHSYLTQLSMLVCTRRAKQQLFVAHP